MTAVEHVTGFPEVPRRPGQDAAPGRARRAPGRPAPSRSTREQLDRARHRAVRPRGGQPLPVRGRRVASGARGTSASSRSTSAARRWSGRRPRTTPGSPWWSTRRATARCSPPVAPAVSPSPTGAGWPRRLRAHGGVRHRRRLLDGPAARRRDATRRRSGRRTRGARLERAAVLRYGENPHQRAALYRDPAAAGGLATAEQLHGKEMSLQQLRRRGRGVAGGVRLRRPGGGDRQAHQPVRHRGRRHDADDPVADAHRKAHACDPVSAFGGVIAVNRPVSGGLAEQIAEVFTEVVVAPGSSSRQPGRAHREEVAAAAGGAPAPAPTGVEFRQISGGVLAQTADRVDAPGDDAAAWRLVAGSPVDDRTLGDLVFAWRACRSVKSNAILLAADRATVGVGMGQVNRVDSARLAVTRAGDRAAGAVAASRRVLPVRGRAAGAARRRRAGGGPAGRLGPGRGGRSRRRRRPASRSTSPARATSPTEGPGGVWEHGRRDGDAAGRQGDRGDHPRRAQGPHRGAARAGDRARARARCWSATTRPATPTCGASTATAPRSASAASASSCRPTATQAEVEAVVDELNADPACTGVHRAAAAAARPRAQPGAGPDRPGQGRRRAAPDEPRLARARRARRRCRARRAASSSCSAGTACRSPAPGSPWSAAASPSAGRCGLLLTRKSENATVTLCHTGTRDLPAVLRRGGHRGGRRRRRPG